jgi:hypothetical protein
MIRPKMNWVLKSATNNLEKLANNFLRINVTHGVIFVYDLKGLSSLLLSR